MMGIMQMWGEKREQKIKRTINTVKYPKQSTTTTIFQHKRLGPHKIQQKLSQCYRSQLKKIFQRKRFENATNRENINETIQMSIEKRPGK